MAKTSGGVRTYKQGSSTYLKRQAEVETMRRSGRYSSVTMGRGGGYVAIEKSPMKHKKEEIELASILANKGYKVILKNESGSDPKIKTPDGYLFNASFEQKTPIKDGANTIRNALFHAKSKRAGIALIYSKKGAFSRESVEKGIKLYEEASSYRFNRIIVVSDNGNVHRHKHNK